MGEWCKHYRAMSEHDTCEIGIEYKTVRDTNHKALFPCWEQGPTTCASAVYPTPEETAAHLAEIGVRLRQFQTDLDNDICPHCKTPIVQWNQVGRCVYAAPCHCRLYQGTVPARHKRKR